MALLHRHATARHLALLRIWVFGAWMADLLKDPIAGLSAIPFDYFQPIGVLRWFPQEFWSIVHSEGVLRFWWATLLALLFLSVLGVPFYRLIAGTTCVLLTFYEGMIFGFSELTHAELAPLYVAYVVAVFPAADALSLRSVRRPASPRVYQTAMLAATITFLATYMLVGVRRLFAGGIDIFVNGTILRIIAERSATPDYLGGSLGLWLLESQALAIMLEVGFVVVTLFEVFSLLCLSSPVFRRSWLIVMLLFHALTWPLMQTLFLHNILLFGVLLVDRDGVELDSIPTRWARKMDPHGP